MIAMCTSHGYEFDCRFGAHTRFTGQDLAQREAAKLVLAQDCSGVLRMHALAWLVHMAVMQTFEMADADVLQETLRVALCARWLHQISALQDLQIAKPHVVPRQLLPATSRPTCTYRDSCLLLVRNVSSIHLSSNPARAGNRSQIKFVEY
eukprot:5628302-Amphidinium_carterae.1